MPAPEAINFNKDSIFQLKPIEPEKIQPDCQTNRTV